MFLKSKFFIKNFCQGSNQSVEKYLLAQTCHLEARYSDWTLKYGSEEKGSSLCKGSILLGFIMSKNLRGL